MSAARRWRALDDTDPPRLVGFEPLEPGDPAYHRDELQLYWPFVGAQAWALGIESADGGELES